MKGLFFELDPKLFIFVKLYVPLVQNVFGKSALRHYAEILLISGCFNLFSRGKK